MRCQSLQFTCKDGTFVAEASNFGPLREGHLLDKLTPLYADAKDKGIFITSSKTGITIRYYLARTERDNDGDVKAWMFRPVAVDISNYPAAARTKVVIFND